MKQLAHFAMLAGAVSVAFNCAAQNQLAPEPRIPALMSAPVQRGHVIAPALRKPPGDAGSGPVLQYQTMQKLKQRFEQADLDGDGSLSRDEARKAGISVVDKNFEHIDSAQRGTVNFEDLKTFLIQRREEARSR